MSIKPCEWGPALWNIIHVASLKAAGNGKKMNQQKADARLFIALIRILPYSLPCKLCQKHAEEYLRKQRRQSNWLKLEGDALRAEIVHFFWEFHNNVNAIKEIPTPFYEFETLKTKYSAEEAQKQVKQDLVLLVKTIRLAMQHYIVSVENGRTLMLILGRIAEL